MHLFACPVGCQMDSLFQHWRSQTCYTPPHALTWHRFLLIWSWSSWISKSMTSSRPSLAPWLRHSHALREAHDTHCAFRYHSCYIGMGYFQKPSWVRFLWIITTHHRRKLCKATPDAHNPFLISLRWMFIKWSPDLTCHAGRMGKFPKDTLHKLKMAAWLHPRINIWS